MPNAEAVMKIQLSSIKLDMEETCKKYFLKESLFLFWQYNYFYKNILFLLTCNGFNIDVFK